MKTTKEMIDVMQSYLRGEEIEVCYLFGSKDYWIACCTPIWDWNNFDYRVKPKKKYVPFETAEEFLTAYRKHGEFIENKESGEKMNAYVDKNGIVILSTALNCTYTFESLGTLFGYYKFSDGTPCGKEGRCMPTLTDRTLSVGLLHAAASELLIRRAMKMHEAQGMRLRHEAKRALTDFNEAYKRFARAYDRLQELATDKNIDTNTAQLFDAFLNDSGTLAMVSMLYFNATNESNPQ